MLLAPTGCVYMNLKRGDVGGRPINQRDGLDDFLSLLDMAVGGPSSQSRPPVESLSLPLLSLLCIR